MYANDDVLYAQNRLINTLITYGDAVVEVIDVALLSHNDPLQVLAIPVLAGGRKKVVDSIDAFDLTPIKLGFVMSTKIGSLSYMERMPIREDWRQGTRQQNVKVVWGDPVWDREAVAKTAQNIFPKLDELRAGVKKLTPWTRQFAVNEKNEIFYKWYGRVGNFPSNDNNNYLLDNEFFWVEEALREAIG